MFQTLQLLNKYVFMHIHTLLEIFTLIQLWQRNPVPARPWVATIQLLQSRHGAGEPRAEDGDVFTSSSPACPPCLSTGTRGPPQYSSSGEYPSPSKPSTQLLTLLLGSKEGWRETPLMSKWGQSTPPGSSQQHTGHAKGWGWQDGEHEGPVDPGTLPAVFTSALGITKARLSSGSQTNSTALWKASSTRDFHFQNLQAASSCSF